MVGDCELSNSMLTVSKLLKEHRTATDRLILPFEMRQKSRLRARLESGVEVGLFLERGTLLRGGDLLLAENGLVIQVVAASEKVSTVTARSPRDLTRAAYHLGNRHMALQVGDTWLRYLHDHVLDEMVRGLALDVVIEEAPFEPEAGAYGAHSHGQGFSKAPLKI